MIIVFYTNQRRAINKLQHILYSPIITPMPLQFKLHKEEKYLKHGQFWEIRSLICCGKPKISDKKES